MTYLIKNIFVVNEDKITPGDVFIRNGRIEKIGEGISVEENVIEIVGEGLYLFPGVIDDQVHFREPGLTHKGDIFSESRAAVAGGVTSFMEMPNTVPNTLTQELLEDKYRLGAEKSIANYSFFMGVSNDNADEVLKTDPSRVCGIKIFMGSSTGNMLVDSLPTLEKIFASTPMLIATHCEDEKIIRANFEKYNNESGGKPDARFHPLIRSAEACYASSSFAVSLAKKHGTRLHILHISTALETGLFANDIPLQRKKITAEACLHHLWFTDADYAKLGNLIKWNPAIKSSTDREGLWKALLDDRIDVIATDHAPHLLEEKNKPYTDAPSGGPLVQHSLPVMLEFYHQGKISLEKIAQKMAHNVATCFRIKERGYIREGYFADLVIADLNKPWQVRKENLLYKCGWSPFEGTHFRSSVTHTFVNGKLVYEHGKINEAGSGARMVFEHNS